MTLGIGIITQDYACLVSDRRTTGAGLKPCDEFDKMCFLTTRDARVAISFAGLAEVGSYNSKVRLIENLKACAPPDHILVRTLGRMTDVLNKEFLTHRDVRGIRPINLRRFTLLALGFRRQWNIDFPCFAMISNFQDLETRETADLPWPEFRPFLADLPPQVPAHGLAIGQVEALDTDAWIAVVNGSPKLRPGATVARLVRQVQSASTRAPGIGGQVTSIIVPRSWDATAMTAYHVLTCQRSTYFPAQINAATSPVTVISSAYFSHNDPQGPILCTPVAGRNKPCPCGSKRKYKACHSPKAMLPFEIHFPLAGPPTFNGRPALPDMDTALRDEKKRQRQLRKDRKYSNEQKKHRLQVAAQIAELRTKNIDGCPLCNDTGWVCDKHLDRPWNGNRACNCGASGAPCHACNYPTPGQSPRAVREGSS